MEDQHDILGSLVDAGRKIAAAGRGLGDDIEVFLLRRDAYPIAVHEDEIRPELRVGRVQVGMRLLRGGSMALASTASLDPKENIEALRRAMAVGRPAGLESFAAARTKVRNGIDPSLLPYVQDPALVQDLAIAIRRRYLEQPRTARIASFEASCDLGLTYRALITGSGEGGWSRGALSSYAELEANHSDRIYRPVIDEAAVQDLQCIGVRLLEEYPEQDLLPEDLGIKGERVQALLEPRLGESILRTVLQEKLLAQTLASGGTQLKPGVRLFGSRFTLDSLGEDAALMNCGPCDDEGTPTQRTRLIEGGVFRGFVSSRRSAARTGLAETGNGMRAPLFDEEASEALIRDRILGMELAAGTRSKLELIASMERGVVLFSLLGLHGADKARGRFSTTAHGGFAVRDGKVVGRLAPGQWSIAGRLFDDAQGPSIFAEVEPSAERVLTGSGRIPWLLAQVDVS